jgi:hypothetical protein
MIVTVRFSLPHLSQAGMFSLPYPSEARMWLSFSSSAWSSVFAPTVLHADVALENIAGIPEEHRADLKQQLVFPLPPSSPPEFSASQDHGFFTNALM